jgi:transposase
MEVLMGKSYSQDLRERVVFYLEAGHTHREAHAVYKVGISTAGRWQRIYRKEKRLCPKPHKRSVIPKLEGQSYWLLSEIERDSSQTLIELRDRLLTERGIRVSGSMVWRFLDSHSISFKKNAAR